MSYECGSVSDELEVPRGAASSQLEIGTKLRSTCVHKTVISSSDVRFIKGMQNSCQNYSIVIEGLVIEL